MTDDWKKVLKEDIEKEWGDQSPGQGYGTRNMERDSQGTLDFQDEFEEIEERTDEYHDGVKCFYCDEDAEWKCTNGRHGGCSYEGDRHDGVQVCGANSAFASSEYPEGHKTYAHRNNSGHAWVDINTFTLDDEKGYKHDNHS